MNAGMDVLVGRGKGVLTSAGMDVLVGKIRDCEWRQGCSGWLMLWNMDVLMSAGLHVSGLQKHSNTDVQQLLLLAHD